MDSRLALRAPRNDGRVVRLAPTYEQLHKYQALNLRLAACDEAIIRWNYEIF